MSNRGRSEGPIIGFLRELLCGAEAGGFGGWVGPPGYGPDDGKKKKK